MLSISSSQIQDSLVITLEGRIDAATAKELEPYAIARLEEGARKLVLDLSRVNFISSAGLRAILLISKKMESGAVKLAGLNNALRDIFDISGFSNLFVLTATVEEAL